MREFWKKHASAFLKNKKRKLSCVIAVMAIAVVFVTAYMLMVPAVTIEKMDGCGLELHKHTKDCYNEKNELTCGYADFVVHTHEQNCYNKEGILICPLLEKKEHAHGLSCYAEEKELICGQEEKQAHTHQPECYEKQKGELSCIAEEHTHNSECYDEIGTLICQKEEHTHIDECYQWKDVLVCGKEEGPGHTHTEGCYKTNKVLVCKKPEIVLHTHTDECYENGKLICEKVEVKKHQHTKKCVVIENKKPENLESKSTQKSKDNIQNASEPLNIDKYIQDFQLSYKNEENNQWVEITNDTQDIPGDAAVLLQINYAGIEISELKDAGYQTKYELPALLKDPEVSGDLKSDGVSIGTIATVGKKVILTFYDDWIQKQEESGMHEINGEFYIESQFDGTHVEEDQPGQIVIGEGVLEVHFEKDVAAKHGKVTVNKNVQSFQQKGDGVYLTYTLDVQVPEGAADVPDVKVVDQFTKNSEYVEEYIGVTGDIQETKDESDLIGPKEKYPENKIRGKVYLGNTVTPENPIPEPAGEDLSKPGVLVWTIGKMTAGESRTLTYEVKLKENYKAVNVNSNNTDIMNLASVYSKIYFRGNSEQHYAPSINVNISKIAGTYVANEKDEGGTISYQIQIMAPKSNTYKVENVKVTDFFSTTAQVPYLDYDQQSFKLYQGKGTSGTRIELDTVRPGEDKQNPIIKLDSNSKKSFDLYIGDLAPGEEKTITYTVNVKPGIWVVSNKDIKLSNVAGIYSDDRWKDGNKKYEESHCDKTIEGKIWSRKVTGEFINKKKTITIPGEDKVYTYDGSVFKQEKPQPESFEVPAYSQQYQIVVNEEGTWDFSNVKLEDTLIETQMKHTGYLKLEAYQVKNPTTGKITDSEAITNIRNGERKETVWLKIDQQQSFAFTPADLEVQGKYAYLLTYYSSLQNPEEHYHIVLHNNFQISGDAIGPKGSEVTVPGISVDNSVTIQGENHYSSEKIAWYYERPFVDANAHWDKGELYWAIKISGNCIPKHMKVKDTVVDINAHKMYPEESLVGIYKGCIPKGKKLNDYKNLQEFEKIQGLEKLDGLYSGSDLTKDYRWEVRENQYLFIEFAKEVQLKEEAGEEMYAIIKTAPQKLPEGKRGSRDYKNGLQTYHIGSDQWKTEKEAKLTVYGSDKIFKETQGAYTYDGSTWQTLTSGKHSSADNLAKELIKEPGTYIEWLVHINWDGTISGTAQIEDQLPEGVELSYVRYYWLSPYYREQNQTIPITPEIQNLEQDSEWEKRTNTFLSQEPAQRTCISYYNRKTGQVRWNVDHLQAGGEKVDQRAIEFQVVCKVTDQDALMSGKDVTMDNYITVTDDMGKYSDSDNIVFQKKTLSKTSLYDKNDGADYPFEIELNPLGEDLVPNIDKITVVDKLSSTLTLAPQTIKVINKKTQEDITSLCHITIEEIDGNQILRLTVPDSMNLKITYETYVNAKPGQTITISNQAHWEGYEVTEGGNVFEPNFSYTAGGSAGGDTKPSLKVIKLDKEHVLKKLEGAIFSVQKMREQQDGTLKPEGEKHMETTDVDGVAMFSQASRTNRWMEFNTIYCLKEEQAPLGYVKDETPYYFAIVKNKNSSEVNEEFPDHIHLWYQSPQYTYAAYNHKGEIAIDKVFKQADGTPLEDPLDGSYQFGIFAEQNASEKPLQTISITYHNGKPTYQKDGQEVAEPVFTQLDVDSRKSYYVFELDDEGKPIKQNELATIGEKTFEVTYFGNGISLDNAENGRSTVKVVNTTKQFILPETGGKGISGYLISGVVVLVLSMVGYFYQKEKIRRRKR